MTVFRWNSLQDLFAIQEKVNRLFEETIHRTEFPDEGLDTALWSPAADVFETPEEIVLNIELPGVRLDDVRLEALDGKLARLGAPRAPTRASSPGTSCAWSASTAASRATSRCRPRSTPGAIKATLRAGVLRVVAPEGRPGPGDPGRAAEGAVKSAEGATGVFRIGAIAERYGIHPQTLRMYEREGLLRPARTEGNTRLYDTDTIERLEIILTLTRHLGVNLAGVEVILHMKQRMEKMHGEVQKMLEVLRDELESRPTRARTGPLALARIPGRRYADRPVRAGLAAGGGRAAAFCPSFGLPSSSAIESRVPNEPFGRSVKKLRFCLAGLAFAASAAGRAHEVQGLGQGRRGLLPDARGAGRVEGRSRPTRRPRSSSPSTGPSAAATPFKQEISRRIAAADQQFKLRATSGVPTRSAAACSSCSGRRARLAAAGAGGQRSTTRGRHGAGHRHALPRDDRLGRDPLHLDLGQGQAPAGARAIGELRGADLGRSRAPGPTSCGTAHRSRRPSATLAEKSIVNPNATLPRRRRRRPRRALRLTGGGRGSARGRPAAAAAAARRPRGHAASGGRQDGARGRAPARSRAMPASGPGTFRSVDRRRLSRHPVLPSGEQAGFRLERASEVRRHRDRRSRQRGRLVLGGRHLRGGGRGHPQGPRLRRSVALPARQLQGHLRPVFGEGQPPLASASVPVQAQAEVDGVRGLAADSLERPRPADQAARAPPIRSSSGPTSRSRSSPRATTPSPSTTASGTSTASRTRRCRPGRGGCRRLRLRRPRRLPARLRPPLPPGRGTEAAGHDAHQRAARRPGRLCAVYGTGGARPDRRRASTAPATRSRWRRSSPGTTRS